VSPTPNPAPQPNGTLLADSCPAANMCMAAGSAVNSAGTTAALVQRWNGTRWGTRASPRPAGAIWSRLLGVSCTSASACTAAGYYENRAGNLLTLAQTWNGTRWRLATTPNPAGAPAAGFFAVSCTSARACTATGSYNNSAGASLPLAERWDGSHWRIQQVPRPAGATDSGLFGIACTSARSCTAAGAYASVAGTTAPLVQRWNGTRWHVQTTPSPAGSAVSGLSAVSCTAATACTAAGSFTGGSGATTGLAERWNGTRWAIQAVPVPAGASNSELLAVSCTAPRSCTAVGDTGAGAAGGPRRTGSGAGAGGTLAERWNGSRWHVQPTPGPAGDTGSAFAALSCTSSRACAAVGSFTRASNFASLTLAAGWDGTRWAVRPTPNRHGAAFSNLLGVSCPAAVACTAVGFYNTNADTAVTLAETWDGTRWRIQRTPSPAGSPNSVLFAVSCSSTSACTATGSYDVGTTRSLPFAERWDGTRWRLQTTPRPAANAARSTLSAVSCATAHACTAVGSYTTPNGDSRAFAERWNGTRWQVQAVPKAAKLSWFQGVSCPGAHACTAAGYAANGVSNARPLVQTWNGTHWQIQPTPLPAGADGGLLLGVSCPSLRACTAGGSLFASPGGAMGDTWNGTAWRVHPAPNPPDFQTSTSEISLAGVSCTAASACTAIGNYTPDHRPSIFGEAWDGARWRLQATPSPAGTLESNLSGVSCAGPHCVAVGSYVGPSELVVTLALVAAR
jgi:hypothetical protein